MRKGTHLSTEFYQFYTLISTENQEKNFNFSILSIDLFTKLSTLAKKRRQQLPLPAIASFVRIWLLAIFDFK